ncbi:hypothetical protein ABIC61_002024 [Curtobacterium sp. 1544]
MGSYDEQIGRNPRRVRQELLHLDEATRRPTS